VVSPEAQQLGSRLTSTMPGDQRTDVRLPALGAQTDGPKGLHTPDETTLGRALHGLNAQSLRSGSTARGIGLNN